VAAVVGPDAVPDEDGSAAREELPDDVAHDNETAAKARSDRRKNVAAGSRAIDRAVIRTSFDIRAIAFINGVRANDSRSQDSRGGRIAQTFGGLDPKGDRM
jgi:hypothetical protein